jgi:hypothetical protein
MRIEDLVAFFAVKSYIFVVLIVLGDWLTGVVREVKRGTFSWGLFPIAFLKLINYTLVFIALHGLAVSFDSAQMLEEMVMLAVGIKEVISFLQNVKAIGIIEGKNNKLLDEAIEFLRLRTWQANLDTVQPKNSYVETE